MRYKITVEYFGKNYSGWQTQKNGIGIQHVLESALSELLAQPVKVVGSGRTDAGVHAMGQVAHFDAQTPIPPEKIAFAANTALPEDIKIKSCEPAPPDFHAQYGAKRKTYLYKTYVSRSASPLRDSHYAQIIPPVDIEAMRRSAKALIGKHDFIAFSASGRTVKTTVREIYRLDITENGDEIYFEIEGNGFLYNMVRIIVGTLVYVGKGKLPESITEEMLASGSRVTGGKTFPPQGLYLKDVTYQ